MDKENLSDEFVRSNSSDKTQHLGNEAKANADAPTEDTSSVADKPLEGVDRSQSPLTLSTVTRIWNDSSLTGSSVAMLNNAAVLAAHPSHPPNPVVFFDITAGSKYAGRLVIELFGNVVPRTVNNFLQYCNGSLAEDTTTEAGKDDVSLKRTSYKGSTFHRIVPRFLIQGGNILNNLGEYFADENFLLKHETAGQLSLANGGAPNTADGAQFFITTAACPHMDGKHVVFGLVRHGLGILAELAATPTDAEDRPTVPMVISNCGEICPGDSLGQVFSCVLRIRFRIRPAITHGHWPDDSTT
jgi:cyclophilin family peptidyl-prolyl cis-trans isomerase